MKRISLILLGGLLLNSYVIAQAPHQEGKATHELAGDGFVAAHPSRTMGTKITVENMDTGKQIEVTIVKRITGSSARIIDLSPAAWEELGLNEDNKVGLYFSNVPTVAAQPDTDVAQAVPPPQAPETEPVPPASPPELPPPPPVAPPPPPVVAMESPPTVAPPPQSPARTVLPTAPAHNVVPPAPPGQRRPINVIPGIPSPYTSAAYRLQLGAFSNVEHAVQCFQRLLSAGFVPFYEPYGSLYRVVLPGVSAADIYWIIQRLDAAGFTDVWIREER
jgi:cell division septation protein DedD